MDLQLKGKRALITGASKGIGFAVAKSLAAEDCHLELAARGADGLEAARKMLAQSAPGIEVRTHAADLSKVEDQERLAQACTAVDILVFPSSHAAIAAGIAGALSAIWPAHRRMFLGLAVMVAASRFIIGAHHLSDVLLGCAVGLAIVVLIQTLFYQCEIYLGSQGSTEQ